MWEVKRKEEREKGNASCLTSAYPAISIWPAVVLTIAPLLCLFTESGCHAPLPASKGGWVPSRHAFIAQPSYECALAAADFGNLQSQNVRHAQTRSSIILYHHCTAKLQPGIATVLSGVSSKVSCAKTSRKCK